MGQILLKWSDITGNTTGRVMLSLFAFLVVLSSSFVYYAYTSNIMHLKERELAKLDGIAKSLALQIDGNLHQSIYDQCEGQAETFECSLSQDYRLINEKLRKVKEAHNLPTDIYTLVYNPHDALFRFVATSAEKPYFKDVWRDYHQSHVSQYERGGAIGPYTDEHGSWLSSFAPIRNAKGETVGILQADEPFDSFIYAARKDIGIQVALIALILIIVVFGMMRYIDKTLRKEDALRQLLHEQSLEISAKNRSIMSSISRAKTIQDAMLPEIAHVQRAFPEMFIMFQPRDIVSGDFFWFNQKNNVSYFAVADCTGHGVPGAFMSLIGHTLLNEALADENVVCPATLMERLDQQVSNILYQKNKNRSADGMDIALICYYHETQEIYFSGAMRPLVLARGKEVVKIAGDKFSIGGYDGVQKKFTNTAVPAQPGRHPLPFL